MNYRHEYHAGNFADCVKHALLVWLLAALTAKPKPLFVLDTHAGIGRYQLDGPAARKTGEAERGILRLLARGRAELAALAPYLELIGQLGLYPGSPAIAAALLRPQDELVACELHEEDAALLRRNFRDDARVHVHRRDGYAAIRAFLPPPQKRALTIIDPPFEVEDEFGRLADAILTAQARLPGGVILAWYPVKHMTPVRAFHQDLRDAAARGRLRDAIAVQLTLREPLDPARLNGCGMIIVNPPWTWADDLPPLLDAALDGLGDGEFGQGHGIIRLADE